MADRYGSKMIWEQTEEAIGIKETKQVWRYPTGLLELSCVTKQLNKGKWKTLEEDSLTIAPGDLQDILSAAEWAEKMEEERAAMS